MSRFSLYNNTLYNTFLSTDSEPERKNGQIKKINKKGPKSYILCKLYILASDFFQKDDKYVFKVKNSCCV